ncbi:hypothetical protein [Methylocystis bryophila]|uniref:Uncharacterized protein n=1 Tax=Methylocystis bryophila TaxID=655015 RepID=A0A1W6MXU3_9HYPH|nr:hypothetical protein [Methylocystis bryophila]ARN82415.1 hypothetical protein B1812_16485 [Methylocystis bryophila]BDV38593.1 hypothetical protein DSM21852_18460 [Methylocystis bryophila]
MFIEPILKMAEAKIRAAVSRMSGAALALAPLVVAIGFGTAAANSWLRDAYGERAAYLVLGAAYLVIAIVIYAAARARERRHAATAAQLAETTILHPLREASDLLSLAGVETALLGLAGKTGAPALRLVAGQAGKNFHLLLGAGIGIYVASRILDALNRRHQTNTPGA